MNNLDQLAEMMRDLTSMRTRAEALSDWHFRMSARNAKRLARLLIAAPEMIAELQAHRATREHGCCGNRTTIDLEAGVHNAQLATDAKLAELFE